MGLIRNVIVRVKTSSTIKINYTEFNDKKVVVIPSDKVWLYFIHFLVFPYIPILLQNSNVVKKQSVTG